MKTADYQHLVLESIRGLPPQALAEVADFAQFLKQRARKGRSIAATLADLSRAEERHLEEEFRDYDKLYPLLRLRSL